MTESEKLAKAVLEGFGFSCEKIKETAEERADYLVQDEIDNYLCEVKERLDDPEDLKRFNEELLTGDIVERSAKIDVTRKIKTRIKKADSQLSETPISENAYKFVWYHVTGQNSNTKKEQILATIYGRHPLIEIDNPQMINCFYLTFSAFFDYKDIVAVVWSDKDRGQLCLNSLSPKYEDFKKTKLYESFKKQNGILDPVVEEANGSAYIADCDISRKNEKAVLEYLAKKYKTEPLHVMRMGHYSGTILLPKEKKEEDS